MNSQPTRRLARSRGGLLASALAIACLPASASALWSHPPPRVSAGQADPTTGAPDTALEPLVGLNAAYRVSVLGVEIGQVWATVAAAADGRQEVLVTARLRGALALFITPTLLYRTAYALAPGLAPTSASTRLGEGKDGTLIELTIAADSRSARLVRHEPRGLRQRDLSGPRLWEAVAFADHLRQGGLRPGQRLGGAVFAGKHLWDTELQVGTRERIESGGGLRPAIALGGQASRRGAPADRYRLTVWLSDDRWRIPLAARVALPVGGVEIQLVRSNRGR